jgi:malic enzyme
MYKTKIEENPIKTNKTLKNIQAGLFFIWFSPTLAHVCKVFDKKKKRMPYVIQQNRQPYY